jgi:hypothetical protein
MAAVTVPPGGSLLGKVRDVLSARRAARRSRPSAVAVFLLRAREHVVTFAALAAADFGAFQVHIPHLGSAPGWGMVCVSLLALHFDMEN